MNINMHDSTEVSARKHDKQNETLCDICGRHMHARTRAGTTRSSINMQTFPIQCITVYYNSITVLLVT
jgi:hypothetical protein